ncbi:MAG: NADH-quinone oxidoreductase subunit C [Coriobacteriales bacterium]|jgi:hypothetical protein|nr:NADH-quinone oxidoreductase subunit C [Coriobacteriales bacterium]
MSATMRNERPQIFIDIMANEMRQRAEAYQERGWRFVNICGSTTDTGVELIYSFSHGLSLENLRFVIGGETTLPSVSDCFPNAFFFENETHDLFGVRFSGISIDFDGEFYALSVPTPMNPRSTKARAQARAASHKADGDKTEPPDDARAEHSRPTCGGNNEHSRPADDGNDEHSRPSDDARHEDEGV